MNRRRFLRHSALATALTWINQLPLSAFDDPGIVHLTILHTNDVHSRIEPFPADAGRNAGQGGVARRAGLIKRIREEEEHVLLLDAGDIFQGTPYFNLFGGELEIKLMSRLKYDAATIGNHDFDAGIDGLVRQLPHATFPFVISNYGFSDTALAGKTETNRIFHIGGMRIGLYGLGIELEGLVPESLFRGTRYFDPIQAAQSYERFLKHEMDCDYIICLSHLGYRYRDSKVSDVILAGATRFTDLILGGHTHTFMKEPHYEKNLEGFPVLINQVGWAGIFLGRIDLYFERGSRRKALRSRNLAVG